jgi:3-methyladenine DNA glycosylase/8-oxoguanine DNA glycosylase
VPVQVPELKRADQAQKEEKTMAKDQRLGRLQRLLARLTSNRGELQHIEPSLARFEALFGQIHEAADRQALHTAGKQEASQQFQTLLTEAERLATILQLAVKQHYGIRSEKLADFGLKPFRGLGKSRAKRPAAPASEPPATAASAETPATATPSAATDRS